MGLITRAIIGVALNGGVLYALVSIVDNVTYTGGLRFFVIGGLILGILNLFFKPLLKILSLPLIFITGGLFLIVINGLVLWLLSTVLGILEFGDVSLSFSNFGTYVIGALVFGIINWLKNLIT